MACTVTPEGPNTAYQGGLPGTERQSWRGGPTQDQEQEAGSSRRAVGSEALQAAEGVGMGVQGM